MITIVSLALPCEKSGKAIRNDGGLTPDGCATICALCCTQLDEHVWLCTVR